MTANANARMPNDATVRSTGPSPSPTAASVGEGGGPGDDDDDDDDPASPLAPATHSLAATHAAMSERHRARVPAAVARAARPIHPSTPALRRLN